MSELPEPFVEDDADLRDFPFTPMFRARLFGSSFHAHATDAEWRAGVTLWLKSWDQSPAGSLPDDDTELCRLAELGRDTKTWKKLKDGALRGWVKCSNGRLYHEVVAEGINEAWASKKARRARTEAARAAKEAKRQQQEADDPPTEDVTNSVTETVTGSKGERQGQGQGKRKEDTCPKRSRVSYPQEFESFWADYPTDALMSKKKTFDAWKRLGEEDREAARAAIPGFREHCRKNPDYRPVHAERFITQRRFDGFNATPKRTDIDPELARLREIEATAKADREGALHG